MNETISTAAGTTKTQTKGFGNKARKVLLGLGVFAIAGTVMGAAPAMARDVQYDRHDDRHDVRVDDHRDEVREFRRGDHEEYHRDVRFEGFRDRFWVPDRYEVRTREDCGRTITERVLIEAGHWIVR